VAAAALLNAALVVVLQTAPPPESPPPTPQSSTTTTDTDAAQDATADIVVTAQKRAENVQDVPISIVAVDAATLERANIATVTDLQRIAPSLTIARAQNTTNQKVTIRGVGTGSSTAIEPSVAFFLDGVYVPRAGSIIGNLVDIAGVEVLRGPQGTLFGRNASVGAISIRTASPTFTRAGSASLILGNYGRIRSEGMINVPLSQTFAVRIAGSAERYDGDFTALAPYPHRLGKLSTVFGRASALWEPTDRLGWTVKADYQTISGDGQTPYEVLPSTLPANNSFPARGDPDGAGPLTGPSLSTGDPYDRVVSNYLFGTADDRVWGLSSDLSYQLGNDYTLRLVNGYRDWRSDPKEADAIQTPLALVRRNQYFVSRSNSHELQFISPKRGLFNQHFDFVGGLYYYRETYAIDSVTDLLQDYCSPFIRNVLPTLLASCLAGPKEGAGADYFDQVTTSKAGYLQGTLHLGEALRFTVGGRYTDDRKSGRMVQIRNNAAEVFHAPEDTSLRLNDNRFTWRAGAQIDVKRDIMVFATYSTGFKSGGFNSSFANRALGQARVFQAETVTNYEAGIRAEFFDRRLTANATLYRTTIDDLQDRGFDGLIFTTRNVGSLRQQGVEFDVSVRPVRAFTAGVSGAYLDSRYLDFRNAPNLPAFAGTQDLTGARANFSPKWQGNAFVQFQDKMPNGIGLLARTDIRHQSAANVGSDSNNNPDTVEPRYNLVSARIGLTSSDERFQISVFGDNLFDKGYCIQRVTQTAESLLGVRNALTGATAIRCIVGTSRRYGVQLKMNFKG
jgi:iron complex outermembrane receptor protein